MIDKVEINKLIEAAKKARDNAFMLTSKSKFGACVLTTDGEYFEGCNIEGVISGLGACAERVAINHAITHGKYQFKAVAVVGEKQTAPCGACLQYLLQFYQINEKDIDIIIADLQGDYQVKKLSELLPFGYLTSNNGTLEGIKRYGRDIRN